MQHARFPPGVKKLNKERETQRIILISNSTISSLPITKNQVASLVSSPACQTWAVVPQQIITKSIKMTQCAPI